MSQTSQGQQSGGLTPGSPAPPDVFIPLAPVTAFLDTVPSTAVSVVVAPAGTGKTASAAAWAAQVADPGGISFLRRVDTPQPVLDALEARTPTAAPPSVVVIDDAHSLEPDTAARLERLLRDSADTQRLLFLSRVELPFIPVELSLAGRVNTLAFPELRFGETDAAALVRAHRPDASVEQVETVVEQSDGWAAALVLGARSLTGQAARPLSGLAPQPLLDYFSSEVFEAASPALKRVLTAVCQEPEVTAEEAVLLSGIASAPYLLAAAAADGLMVTSRPSHSATGGRAWRLHPLLVEVLRRRTAPDGPDWSMVADAHRRAAVHFARVGDAVPGVRHATLTGDLSTQLDVLHEFAPELIIRNKLALVSEALAHIPTELREKAPDLLALDALMLQEQGLHDAAKRVADVALSVPDGAVEPSSDDDAQRSREVDLAILEVWQARCGWRSPARAAARAARALACHHVGASIVTEANSGHDTTGVSPLRSAWLMQELADLQLSMDELPGASLHLDTAGRYAEGADIPRLTRAVLSTQALLHVARGAYETGAQTAEACLRIPDETDEVRATVTARAHLMRGWGRFQALDLDGATTDLAAFSRVPHDPSTPLLQLYGSLLEANIHTARGEVDRARRTLDVDTERSQPLPAFAERHLGLARFRAAVCMGDLSAMETHSRSLRRAGLAREAALTHAVTVGMRGDEPQAVRDLDGLLAEPRADLEDDWVAPAAVTAASAAVSRVAFLQRIGTPQTVARATALVPDMLTRLAPQRLLWILATGLLVTPRLTDLLVAEVARPGGHPFAAEALDALGRHPRRYPDLTPRHEHPGGSASDLADRYGLTGRELDVLQALADGGSNASIAGALFVSGNTVKTHLAAIYRKLGVTDRREALVAARRHGLL